MIAGLDSAICPTTAQVQAAKAAGVSMWSGYLATQARVGLYAPWPREAFDVARQAGATPIAFCSGWDSPGACKSQAALWNVRLCLDVEGGIRPDGPWVQPWLSASGAGLYGNAPVHGGRTAAFHVLAAYVADPQATWSGAAPGTPCGWQWRGTHSEFGIGVDRGWYDDWFLGEEEMDQYSKDTNDKVTEVWDLLRQGTHAAANPNWIRTELEAIKTALAAIQVPSGSSGGLTDAEAGQLQTAVLILERIETNLRAA